MGLLSDVVAELEAADVFRTPRGYVTFMAMMADNLTTISILLSTGFVSTLRP